ncbi:hypothetical protein NFI96_013803 [Prochilodus magdalenae]|nr:hypothetical protein NFI96_013803 [Prochilodus magdalenae]
MKVVLLIGGEDIYVLLKVSLTGGEDIYVLLKVFLIGGEDIHVLLKVSLIGGEDIYVLLKVSLIGGEDIYVLLKVSLTGGEDIYVLLKVFLIGGEDIHVLLKVSLIGGEDIHVLLKVFLIGGEDIYVLLKVSLTGGEDIHVLLPSVLSLVLRSSRSARLSEGSRDHSSGNCQRETDAKGRVSHRALDGRARAVGRLLQHMSFTDFPNPSSSSPGNPSVTIPDLSLCVRYGPTPICVLRKAVSMATLARSWIGWWQLEWAPGEPGGTGGNRGDLSRESMFICASAIGFKHTAASTRLRRTTGGTWCTSCHHHVIHIQVYTHPQESSCTQTEVLASPTRQASRYGAEVPNGVL